MRNDPLIPVPQIPPVYEPLPSQTQRKSELHVDTMLLGQLAEMVAWALKQDTEEDFEMALEKINQLPKSVTLYQTVDPLGCYNSGEKTITIDRAKISRLAEDMYSEGQSVSARILENVVEIHEAQHALHHLAQDTSKGNRIWDGFSDTPSYLLEILAQLFTYHQVQNNQTLETTFLELERRQPTEYGLWRFFKYVPEECLYWTIRDESHRIDRILEKMGFKLPRKAISGWDLRRIAKEIYKHRGGNICGEDMPVLVRKCYPYPSNCYPGKPGNECFETAFFFSLTAGSYANPDKGHLSFREMLGWLARHMNGDCGRITKRVYIFTDNWDANAYDDVKPIINDIKRLANVSVCLIVGKEYSWFGV